MGQRRRIVVVDDDPTVRQLVAQALSGGEFEVHAFADGRDALMKLHDLAPDLILSDLVMPEMDGRTFFQVVKRSERLRRVPFIFLSGVQATDEIVATLEGGADDFVNKPFSPVRLVAKVRATLRLAERAADERRSDDLAGTLQPGATLPLVKFCEDARLTGRLTLRAPGVERWADFRGGELTAAGGTQAADADDALDLLLAMSDGTYRIEQRRLDAAALEQATRARPDERPSEAVAEVGAVRVPGGRLAKLLVRGAAIEVQTEAENRPHFAVTTVIARGGQVLRRVESAWSHPLQRREDEEGARAQVERQHERVLAALRDLGGAAPQAAVDGALLGWALSFVAEQARELLGSVMTVALLRRTHAQAQREHETLRAFRISSDGRVSLPAQRAALPAAAVAAVAAWTSAFLAEAGALVEKAGRLKVRQATRLMEAELERLGFYAALVAVSRRTA